MDTMKGRWIGLGLMLVLAACLGQMCTPAAGPGDGGSGNGGGGGNGGGNGGGSDGGGDGGGGGSTGCGPLNWLACGSRTVTNVPGPGFIEQVDFSFQEAVDPADSPLAKVLFRGSLCTSVDWDFPMPTVLYEVDAQGVVVAQIVLMDSAGVKYYTRSAPFYPMRFVVENGCLDLDIDIPSTMPTDVDIDLPGLDVSNLPTPACGWGARTVDRTGEVSLLSQPSGDYICVETQIGSYSHDCWHENGAWYDETVSTRTYRALGSLDGVSVSAWAQACSGQQQTVDINIGDQVSATMTIRTVYRMSSSPEELGYQPFSFPMGNWPGQ